MAPAHGKTRDDPIVLDHPIVFDLTLSDNEDIQKIDYDDDLLELGDSPAAWQRAQNQRNSTGASTDGHTSPPKPAAVQVPLAPRSLSGEPAIETQDGQQGDTIPAGKQDQGDQKTSPPGTTPVPSECTSAAKVDLVNTFLPTGIENAPAYDISRTNVAPAKTIESPIVSPVSNPQNNPPPGPTPVSTQAAAVLTSNPEHHERASVVEEKREQTLSELTTTNTGLTMSHRASRLDAPSTNGGGVQAFSSSRKQKAIKSVKTAARPKFLKRPRENADQRIFDASNGAQGATTTQPIDTQFSERKLETEPTSERDLFTCESQQGAIAASHINNPAPATISPSAPLLPNIESAIPPSPPSQGQTHNDSHLINSVSLTTTDKECADFGGGHLAVLMDPIPNAMEHELQRVQRCLLRHLDDRHGTHAYLNRAILRRHRTCQERNLRAQIRRQELPAQYASIKKNLQTVSPFEGMVSIQMPYNKKSGRKLNIIHQEDFSTSGAKAPAAKSSWSVQSTTHTSDAVVIPPFKEYVTLKKSMLSDNESKLLTTPFVDDLNGPREKELRRKLPEDYTISHDQNANLEFRLEQCLFYKEMVESFFKELDISWDNILFWLLASRESLIRLDRDSPGHLSYESVISNRSGFEIETFTRDGNNKKLELFDRTDQKWQKLLLLLQQPTAERLRLSSLACKAVLGACGFNVWYLAKQCDIVVSHISQKIKGSTDSHEPTFRTAMCRVCYEHNCLLHGEIRETPTHESCGEDTGQGQNKAQSDDERDDLNSTQSTDTKMPAHTSNDSDVEKSINYRILANADAPNEYRDTVKSRKPPELFKAAWWKNNATTAWDYRNPFFPCNHEGRCDEAKCRCYRENITCEKTCRCSLSCNRRFPGCSSTCTLASNKRVCESKKCLCVLFERECDADICGTCGATEVLDPVNRYDETVLQSCCPNVPIQRGVPSKTLLGHSEVHGFGLYCGEAIKKGGFICEYTGETISKSESDRRHTIYEYQKTTYSFELNKRQDVDATYMGNKTRFINNADTNLANCHAKSLMCNTVQRIGMYASVDMQPGTELFFHYNYTKEQMKGYKQPKTQVVAVKQKTKHAKTRPEHSADILSSDEEASELAECPNRRTTTKERAAKTAKSTSGANRLSNVDDPGDERDVQCYDLAMEVKDTDEDEVEFQPDTAESSNGSDLGSEAAGNSDEDGIMTRGRGRPRKQPDRVVAVKQRRELHTGANRKRKR